VRLSGSIDEGAAASRPSSGIEHSVELVSDGPGIKTNLRVKQGDRQGGAREQQGIADVTGAL